MPHDFTFRPVTRDDYPMLRGWLAQPHVAGIWGDPDEEIALIDEEIDGGDCQMHVVESDHPIGFIQDWCPHKAGVPHMTDMPQGTRSVDTFLGDAACLGKRVAQGYVRAYSEGLLRSGAPVVTTDPRLTNPRGIAMYRAAGFTDIGERICEDGAPVILMQKRPA